MNHHQDESRRNNRTIDDLRCGACNYNEVTRGLQAGNAHLHPQLYTLHYTTRVKPQDTGTSPKMPSANRVRHRRWEQI
jgi:hypothetical protein